MSKSLVAACAGVLVAVGLGFAAYGADHFDAPAAADVDPTADIAGLFAWTDADAARVNLVMTVSPQAGDDARFSDAVQYAFHLNSSAEFGAAQIETLAVCEFDASRTVHCWVGGEEVVGDASGVAGLQSASGRVRVFAGLRDDPFIFSFGGFAAAVGAVVDAAPTLELDVAGCPRVPGEVSGQLVSLLQSDGAGGPAVGTFDGTNVLALVIQVDRALVTPGGPIVGVWASTHRVSR